MRPRARRAEEDSEEIGLVVPHGDGCASEIQSIYFPVVPKHVRVQTFILSGAVSEQLG